MITYFANRSMCKMSIYKMIQWIHRSSNSARLKWEQFIKSPISPKGGKQNRDAFCQMTLRYTKWDCFHRTLHYVMCFLKRWQMFYKIQHFPKRKWHWQNLFFPSTSITLLKKLRYKMMIQIMTSQHQVRNFVVHDVVEA